MVWMERAKYKTVEVELIKAFSIKTARPEGLKALRSVLLVECAPTVIVRPLVAVPLARPGSLVPHGLSVWRWQHFPTTTRSRMHTHLAAPMDVLFEDRLAPSGISLGSQVLTH